LEPARVLAPCSAVNQLPKPDAQFLYAPDPTYSRRQIGGEKPKVCRLIRKTANRSETKVDGARSKIVAQDHGFAERQSRLGAVPLHEFINSVPIAALGVWAGEAVEDGGFGSFEVG
jgi:hypothetical protein